MLTQQVVVQGYSAPAPRLVPRVQGGGAAEDPVLLAGADPGERSVEGRNPKQIKPEKILTPWVRVSG